MAAKKRVDPIKQREKRAKMAAIGGVVLLLGVGGIEVPKIMSLMNPKPVVPPSAPGHLANPDGSVTGALPNVAGTATAATPTSTTASPGDLVDTDVPPATAGSGQLVSFGVFATKNPFRPQVTATPATGTAVPVGSTAIPATATTPASISVTPPAAASGSSPTATTPASVIPSATPSTTTPTPSTGTPAVPSPPSTMTTTVPAAQSVAISVNGVASRVSTNGTFPDGKPIFRLVSWTHGTAQIGIVGGSYSTGDPTLALKVGKAITLQNTSDAQRYKLVLLSTP